VKFTAIKVFNVTRNEGRHTAVKLRQYIKQPIFQFGVVFRNSCTERTTFDLGTIFWCIYSAVWSTCLL